jgi:predicted transcriptional regulator
VSEAARRFRKQGMSHYEIGRRLGLSLSEVRRALDEKAQQLHRLWAR